MSNSRKGSKTYNSKCILQYDRDGNFIKKWDCLQQAAEFYGGFSSNICAASRGRQKTAFGFIWKSDGTSSYQAQNEELTKTLPVYQYSLFGEFMAKYESVALAAQALNIPDYLIYSACCDNMVLTGAGFQWKRNYSGDKITSVVNKVLGFKRVIKLNRDFQIVKIFDTTAEAYKEFPSMGRALASKSLSKKGFYYYRESEVDSSLVEGFEKGHA